MQATPDDLPSTRPYLIRALHEWCCDNGFTPYLAVQLGAGVRVPMEFVRDGQITLNVGLEATQGLQIGNEWIEFKARFGGVAREVQVPVGQVLAIYARENGQGMAFPAPEASAEAAQEPEAPALRLAPQPGKGADKSAEKCGDNPPPEDPGPRPTLKRVK
ncbi:ClpXP protease specificity-enhancing factor [Inhella proteolytica]|uniref:ClpXP protease specificity-enhancing factor n=1 Tax=Inhella proteolytica TaxID=2795029 RepID=A0A931NHA7_9BURK|nr:ClpXP protease specificity-enhancing factor [Inhella proteolytica]MBH9577548.1 ClpXP protease specificity-enhancing factor [Inhella proteolytica]